MDIKKRIIICSNFFPPNFVGGAEIIAYNQAKTLQNLGYEVVVFTGDSKPCGDRHSIRKEIYDGLTVYRIYLQAVDCESKFINFFHKDIENYFEKVLDSFKPTIVHFHKIVGLSLGIIYLAKKRNIKTILTLHDNWGFCHRDTTIKPDGSICHDFTKCNECLMTFTDEMAREIPIFMRKSYSKIMMDFVDYFVSPSNDLAHRYVKAGFDKDKIKVIWNGIDVKKFKTAHNKKTTQELRVSFIGYFGQHKGGHILLNALKLMPKNLKIIANFIGEGEQEKTYKEQIKLLKNNISVRFWGKIDNKHITKAFAETDILVLPSICLENQPVTITEAMAAKIPVIASNIGGIPELIDDKKTGYLFSPGDYKDLAKKIVYVANNPKGTFKVSQNAYKKIKSFSFEAQAKKNMALYESTPPQQHLENQKNKNHLIVCIGKVFCKELEKIIKQISENFRNYKYNFIMSDWIDDDLLKKANVALVIDKNIHINDLNLFLRNKIPIIVPSINIELKNYCSFFNCGLYYSTVEEAIISLRFLLENPESRTITGENAKKLYEKITNKREI